MKKTIETVDELKTIQDLKFDVKGKSEVLNFLIDLADDENEHFNLLRSELCDTRKRSELHEYIVLRKADNRLFQFMVTRDYYEGIKTDYGFEVNVVYPHVVMKIEYKTEPDENYEGEL